MNSDQVFEPADPMLAVTAEYVANLLLSPVKEEKVNVKLVDCSPAVRYNNAHIKTSTHFLCTAIILRRYSQNPLKLLKHILGDDCTSFLEGDLSHVVLYNTAGNRCLTIKKGLQVLQAAKDEHGLNDLQICLLSGGFEQFSSLYPHLCVTQALSTFQDTENLDAVFETNGSDSGAAKRFKFPTNLLLPVSRHSLLQSCSSLRDEEYAVGKANGDYKRQVLEVPKTAACVPPRRAPAAFDITMTTSDQTSDGDGGDNCVENRNIPPRLVLPQQQQHTPPQNDENQLPNQLNRTQGCPQQGAISNPNPKESNSHLNPTTNSTTTTATLQQTAQLSTTSASPSVQSDSVNCNLNENDGKEQKGGDDRKEATPCELLQFKPMLQSRLLHKEHLTVQAALRRKRRHFSVTTECDVHDSNESSSSSGMNENKSANSNSVTSTRLGVGAVPPSPLREIPSPLPGNLPSGGAGSFSMSGGGGGKLPVKVTEGLFLGSAQHAARESVLIGLGITAILNVSRRVPNYFPKCFLYQRLELEDSVGCSSLTPEVFDLCNRFIDSIIFSGGKVLLHCQEGISRSPAICLAYLMCSKRMRLDTAFDLLLSKRKLINPNLSFMCQLAEYERILFPCGIGLASSPGSRGMRGGEIAERSRDRLLSGGGGGVDWYMWHKCLTAPPYIIKRQNSSETSNNENHTAESEENRSGDNHDDKKMSSPVERKRARRENMAPEVFVF